MNSDKFYMARAVKLAEKGAGYTSPNPMVGAVLVLNNTVISDGYHKRFGGPHAEVEALSSVSGDLGRATLYVTLEPCCHHGKTPPCTDLILKKKVGRVVVGIQDPNPKVGGKGIELLKNNGIEVVCGVLEDECRDLNRAFFHWISTGRPWVTLKWAQSLDGRIAAATGHSQWISSEPSRERAHLLRALNDAVLVGVGTALNDDPELTVRLVEGKNPTRVVLDSDLKLPLDSKLVTDLKDGPSTWIATVGPPDPKKADLLESKGARVLPCPPGPTGGVDIDHLLRKLGESQISSLLVEGGGRVISAFLRARAAQELVCFVAPIVMGAGVEAVGDLGVENVSRSVKIDSFRTRRSGADVMITGRFKNGP